MITSMCKLICVTSRTLCPSPFLPRLEAIARAGAGAILLREKDLTPEEYASPCLSSLSPVPSGRDPLHPP